MKYREVARKLASLGCQERERRGVGSHRKWVNPKTQCGAIVPDWGARDLKIGTIRSVVRQLEVDWQEFREA